MSKEYIEREAALAIVYDNWGTLSCSRISYNLEKLPAADVKPVVHGKWYDEDSFRLTQQEGGLHYAPIYRCSVCNKTVADHYISEHKYCLHCGAEMKKES